MKYRTGFVSNSSSSSFVCILPILWNPTDEEILNAIEDYGDGEEKELIAEIRTSIENLRKGETIYQDDFAFHPLNNLIPRDYRIAGFNCGSDEGQIAHADLKKVKALI